MGAKSKRAKTVRTASDFDILRLAAQLAAPKTPNGVFAWTHEQIVRARDAQRLGQFRLAAQLAESMLTDDAISVAYENRLDPLRCLPVKICPGKGPRADAIAGEADALYGPKGLGIMPGTMADIQGTVAQHGVAFGFNVATPRDDGSRVDYFHRAWPIEFVRWDPTYRVFKTLVDPSTVAPGDVPTNDPALGPATSAEIPIVHGDGRWTIYSKHDLKPWLAGALLPAALVWSRHAFANRDWAKGSAAHGNAKVIASLPADVALQELGEDGAKRLTEEAVALLELLQSIANDDTPTGIKPSGTELDFLANAGTMWQVWKELSLNAEKAAARIYLGTDGILGAQGGAPGVSIEELFGVATTKVQGDVDCIERGFAEGVLTPWTATNFGDSTAVPMRKYLLPDEDEAARRKDFADRNAAFLADVANARSAGFAITPEYVEQLAERHGVPAPQLATATPGTSAAALRNVA